jgi:hypothetical protein
MPVRANPLAIKPRLEEADFGVIDPRVNGDTLNQSKERVNCLLELRLSGKSPVRFMISHVNLR